MSTADCSSGLPCSVNVGGLYTAEDRPEQASQHAKNNRTHAVEGRDSDLRIAKERLHFQRLQDGRQSAIEVFQCTSCLPHPTSTIVFDPAYAN